MTTDTDPELLLRQLLDTGADANIEEWLRGGIRCWLACRGAATLEQCLKLPSAGRVARAQRDRWLLEASQHVHGATTWAKACALERVISRRRRATTPPSTKSELAVDLAKDSGAPMGLSTRRIAQIIEARTADNCDVADVQCV